MQLGFVIDQSRCIGCHACTVACKAENDVPVGDFRTWVKSTEEGVHPEVRRSFTVLRCNQCTDAPCVAICPVTALSKRDDGIVDLDRDVCIGCKACLQGCPYDALYINASTGTAEKCHFCAHRVEVGLAPACAVVCPTEAIVPGDFDDPASRVATLAARGDLTARRTEAGTGPNVLYRQAAAAGIDPSLTSAAGGYLWAQQRGGPQLDADLFEALERQARARTVYGVDRQPAWGAAISGYLFLKSVAAGVFVAGMGLLPPAVAPEAVPAAASIGLPLLALAALGATLALLVADLKRPARFLSILLRPNRASWLAKGSFVLLAYGLLLTAWLLAGLADRPAAGASGITLVVVTGLAAALSAAYTAWLFGQAKGRVLWMQRGLALHLLAQAVVAGAALLLILQEGGRLVTGEPLFGTGRHELAHVLGIGLAVHAALVLTEGRRAPRGREAEYARAVRLVTHGPYARRHAIGTIGLGLVVPAVLLLSTGGGVPWMVAGAAALAGLAVAEDVLVRAGQALPIS